MIFEIYFLTRAPFTSLGSSSLIFRALCLYLYLSLSSPARVPTPSNPHLRNLAILKPRNFSCRLGLALTWPRLHFYASIVNLSSLPLSPILLLSSHLLAFPSHRTSENRRGLVQYYSKLMWPREGVGWTIGHREKTCVHACVGRRDCLCENEKRRVHK